MIRITDTEARILAEAISLGGEAAIHLLRQGKDPRVAFRALLTTVDLDVEAAMDRAYGPDDKRTRETKP